MAGRQTFIKQYDHIVLGEESIKKCDEILTDILKTIVSRDK